MKIADRTAAFAQGDVMLIPVDSLPKGLDPVRSEKGALIVTHSETGHHHVVMERPGVQMFQDKMDLFRSFLVLDSAADLEHLRTFDTHESVRLSPGIWEVRRQREYSPAGWQRAAD